MGADETVLINLKTFDVEAITQEIKDKFGGNGANTTFECTGNEGSTKVAIYSTNNGGKVALVGLGPLEVKVPLVNASLREVDIIGICRFRNWSVIQTLFELNFIKLFYLSLSYPMAIYLLETGKVNLKPLVTHKYPLEKSLDAFKKMIEPDNNAIKVLIQCNKDFQ